MNDSSTGTFSGTGTAGANYNVSVTKSIPVTFTNDGNLTVSAGTLSLSGGGSSAGTINTSSSGATVQFTNNGTYNKLATGLTSIDVTFVNNNGAIYVSAGTLRFASSFQQTAGTVAVSDGATVEFVGGLNLAAGTLTGNGTIQGNIANSGLLSPGSSPGQLNVTGNLTLASTAVLLFELDGVSQSVNYDYFSVSGTAQLNGDLRLAFVNGFHSNATYSQTFTVLTASSLIGLFANVNNGQRLFTLDGYGTFVVNYGASSAFTALTNSVVLSEFIAVPEPSTWALMLTGVGALAATAWRRRRR